MAGERVVTLDIQFRFLFSMVNVPPSFEPPPERSQRAILDVDRSGAGVVQRNRDRMLALSKSEPLRVTCPSFSNAAPTALSDVELLRPKKNCRRN